MGTNVRAHVEQNAVHEISIQELMDAGFDVHINGDAQFHSNVFGVYYATSWETDATFHIKNRLEGEVLKDLIGVMPFYAYDGVANAYAKIIDVYKDFEDEYVVNVGTDVKTIDDLVVDYMGHNEAVDYSADENVKQIPPKKPTEPITRKKFRF